MTHASANKRYTLRLTWTTSIWKTTMCEIRQWHYFLDMFFCIFIVVESANTIHMWQFKQYIDRTKKKQENLKQKNRKI